MIPKDKPLYKAVCFSVFVCKSGHSQAAAVLNLIYRCPNTSMLSNDFLPSLHAPALVRAIQQFLDEEFQRRLSRTNDSLEAHVPSIRMRRVPPNHLTSCSDPRHQRSHIADGMRSGSRWRSWCTKSALLARTTVPGATHSEAYAAA
jgi:hypothetical protein